MLNENNTTNQFKGKVRVRVSGILEVSGEILLLKHDGIGPAGYLWSPPGGGVAFGESLVDALKKEFLEETNIQIAVGKYLFTNEFIGEEYHAIELFFEVTHLSGSLRLGADPELAANEQILTEARFFSAEEIANLPANAIHNVFNTAGATDKITDLRGLFTFKH